MDRGSDRSNAPFKSLGRRISTKTFQRSFFKAPVRWLMEFWVLSKDARATPGPAGLVAFLLAITANHTFLDFWIRTYLRLRHLLGPRIAGFSKI
jgi:hypothetical protein